MRPLPPSPQSARLLHTVMPFMPSGRRANVQAALKLPLAPASSVSVRREAAVASLSAGQGRVVMALHTGGTPSTSTSNSLLPPATKGVLQAASAYSDTVTLRPPR